MDLMESYSWMAPEFKIVDAGKNTIRIKGIALRSDVTSKNNRKYIDEELIKSARTFIGKPVTINHDMNRKAGHVVWMEYEDGVMEYLIDVKKQPYVGMLRDKSAEIRGVSIEANYLHNRCSICDKKFYDEPSFHDHMHKEHFIQGNPKSEPHGILGQALSLVLSPEEAGYEGTTIELMEMYQKPVLRLLETVIKTNKEKENLKKKLEGKVVIKTEKRQTYDKQLREKQAKEQEDGTQEPAHPVDPEGHECKEGSHWDKLAGTCIPDEIPKEDTTTESPPIGPSLGEDVQGLPPVEQSTPPPVVCPTGFTYDKLEGTCVADVIPTTKPPTNAPLIVPEPNIETPKVDVTTPAPVVDIVKEQLEDPEQPVPHPVDPEGKECGEGSHYDEVAGTCVPDEIVAVEYKLPTLLRLGEPFGSYTDFADCVSKNKDKDDPDAFCADIKRKVEGEDVKETYKLDGSYIRDIKIASKVNKLNESVALLMAHTKKLDKPLKAETKIRANLNKKVKEIIDNINESAKNQRAKDVHDKAYIDKILKARNKLEETSNDKFTELINVYNNFVDLNRVETGRLRSAHNKLVEFDTEKLNSLATAIHNTDSNFAKRNQAVTAWLKSAQTERKALHELVMKQKADYEQILAGVDKKYIEAKTVNKTLEQRIQEQEDELDKRKCGEDEHFDEEAQKCVPNTPPEAAEETKNRLKETTEIKVKLENLEHKFKQLSQFKGQSKPLESEKKDEFIKDETKTGGK